MANSENGTLKQTTSISIQTFSYQVFVSTFPYHYTLHNLCSWTDVIKTQELNTKFYRAADRYKLNQKLPASRNQKVL
jgi:hypothetical protein